jgi:2-hydroxymuconate-semialdehyde hydrolase
MAVSNTQVKTGNYHTYTNISGEDQKEAILFLHGSGPGVTAWSNWQYALPAEDSSTIAPDLAGLALRTSKRVTQRHASMDAPVGGSVSGFAG